MKKILAFYLIATTILGSATFAGKDELLQDLDMKGLKIALKATTHNYQVNWKESFDFNDSDDEKRSNTVLHFLDAVLGEKIEARINQKSKVLGGLKNPEYVNLERKHNKARDKQNALSESQSAWFLSEYEAAQINTQAPTIIVDSSPLCSSSLAATRAPESSELDSSELDSSVALITTRAPQSLEGTNRNLDDLEASIEQLDERELRIALQATTNGYIVNWNEFDMSNREDDVKSAKVEMFLDNILSKRIDSYAQERRSLSEGSNDPQFEYLTTKINKIQAKRDALLESRSQCFMEQYNKTQAAQQTPSGIDSSLALESSNKIVSSILESSTFVDSFLDSSDQ
ncbi:MAG: hypothetical protein K2W92_06070 [Alphaproteobacteria bacterium]|nr:hypothetical protein [Alphaproteobacteria bacterium]